jgi:hypothetical protein
MKINVVEVKELSDGGAEIVFDLDAEAINHFKKLLGIKRWSKKKFQQFVIEALVQKLKEEE